MPLQPSEIDRTGTMLEHEDSLVVIEVADRSTDGKLYLLRDHMKNDPLIVAGGYFVTCEQLEVMIIGYETGLWLDNTASAQ